MPLASAIFRRLVASGTGLNLQALGALDVVGQASCAGLVSTAAAAITGDLNVSADAHVSGLVTMKGWGLCSFQASPEISLSTNGATVDFPAVAGFIPPWIFSKWLITSLTGTATANPSTKAGNNATFDNLYGPANVPGSASINVGVSGLSAITINSSTTAPLIDLTTPIRVTVVTGATGTGGFQAKGRLLLWCGLTAP